MPQPRVLCLLSRSASAGALSLALHPHALPGKALITPGNVGGLRRSSATPSVTLASDVVEAASSVLSVYSPTARHVCTRGHESSAGCAEAGKRAHAAIRERQYGWFPGASPGSSVSVPMTLRAHNFKLVITQILNTHPSAVTPRNNTERTGLI